MSSRTFNLDRDSLITGVNVIDGQIFWVDDRNEPRKLDIEKFKSANHETGTTAIFGRPFQDRDITVKRPDPDQSISFSVATDGTEIDDFELGSTDAPSVQTFAPRDVSSTRALLAGFSFDPGTALQEGRTSMLSVPVAGSLFERGFYISSVESTEAGLFNNGIRIDASLDGNTFQQFATGLIAGTRYYVVAFASNSFGTTYGAVLSFMSLALPGNREVPETVTLPATNITPTSITLNGRVDNLGGDTIADQGFRFGTADMTRDQIIASGRVYSVTNFSNPFSFNATGLNAGTGYGYVAFCTNGSGTDYGSLIRVNTSSLGLPQIDNNRTYAHTVLDTSANLLGTTLNTGGSAATARGFFWSDTATTATELRNSGTRVSSNLLGGLAFGAELSNLNSETTYRFIPFITNSSGTAYGTVQTFTTQATVTLSTPSVSTGNPELVGSPGRQTTIRGRGRVLRENGATITQRGIILGTSPTQSGLLASGNSQVVLGTTGNYSFDFEGLTPGTQYYTLAFATNSQGTSYGGVIGLATPAREAIPSVANGNVFITSQTTANVSGNVLSSLGSSVTDRGFIVGTQSSLDALVAGNPRRSSADNSLGLQSGVLGGVSDPVLTPNEALVADTDYFYVAYAENDEGVGYSPVRSFRTDAVNPENPVVATLLLIDVGSVGAVLRGALNSDGGAAVTSRGFRFALATVSDADLIAGGAGVNTLSSSSFGGTEYQLGTSSPGGVALTSNTEYKYVAFATNSSGTGYGSVLRFTTRADVVAPTVITSSAVNITTNEALLSGDIINVGGGVIPLDDKGFYVSPVQGTAAQVISSGTFVTSRAPGTFLSATATGLLSGVQYYYVAWARNSAGQVGTGDVLSFRTSGQASVSASLIADDRVVQYINGIPNPLSVNVRVFPTNASFSFTVGMWSDRSGTPRVRRVGNVLFFDEERTSPGITRSAEVTITHSQNRSVRETITLVEGRNVSFSEAFEFDVPI